jgi:UDP-glucose 4-epimerase
LKRVLVTGSEGFIGKSLCNQLIQMRNSYEMFTMDKLGSGKKHVRADIAFDDFSKMIQQINPEVVLHLAGNVSVPFSIKSPLEDFNVNAKGTLNLLLALESTVCRNFIFVTSGGAIYDPNTPMPFSETSPINPISPYGLSKYVAEGYVRVLSELRHSNWSSLALSNVYGSINDQKQGVVYRFWDDITKGVSPKIFGIDATRDFIHIDDVVSALIKVIENPVNTRLNISSNISTRLEDLLNSIQEIMGSNLKPEILNLPRAEIAVSQLNNSKAQELLGWNPTIGLEIGLRRSLGL